MASHLNDLIGSHAAVKQAGKNIAALIMTGSKPTPNEIRHAILSAGLSFSNPAVELKVDQCTDTVFAIALPSKAQLEATRATIAGTGEYVLPTPFKEHIETPATDPDDLLDFYDFRLGDYVLQHCD
mgnify:CR=1 FL=1